MKENALIIGCGNIGALYDFETNDITTHSKALFFTDLFNLFFYDSNHILSKKISDKYHGTCLKTITDELLNSVDWISLCTPTDTHYSFLKKLLCLKNKFILCEKPVSYNREELEDISLKFNTSPSRVFVNYFRRFQPSYIDFKIKNSGLLKLHCLKECTIDYCRGFINNGSHAFDLLEFLFETPVQLENIRISKAEYDAFINDPTVSLTAEWDNAKIVARGHPYSIFQIKLVFDSFIAEFTNSGNEISIYEANNPLIPFFYQKDCLKNYMQNVISYFTNTKIINENSNFVSSLKLNLKLLNYIGL